MKFSRNRLVCAGMALTLLVQSVWATPCATEPVASVPVPTIDSGSSWTSSVFPIAIMPLSAVSPALLEQQRSSISAQLVNLGFEAVAADGMAGELTAGDLAVLSANPKMMQKAGDMDATLELLLWTVIIVGTIVVLVIVADSSTIIVNS